MTSGTLSLTFGFVESKDGLRMLASTCFSYKCANRKRKSCAWNENKGQCDMRHIAYLNTDKYAEEKDKAESELG